MFIGIILIGFACGAVFGNSIFSVILSLFAYTGLSTLLLSNDSITLADSFLLSQNWDFSQYLFGRVSGYEFFTLQRSIIVCLIYFAIIIIPAFIYFRKGDIGSK